jgi:hypothetical protein
MMFSVEHCFVSITATDASSGSHSQAIVIQNNVRLFVFALRQKGLGESDVRPCLMEFRLRRQIQHIG